MGKRGPKPKKIISEEWSSNLAYAVGLLTADGCLSTPVHGHLIDLTSKDREQLENFLLCLNAPYKITQKNGGGGRKYLRVQFKNVFFYNFLLSIGLTPAKSKTLGALKIPDEYFFDFLRGLFDGDGCTYSYWDKRWRSSFMFYLAFVSASIDFIEWLRTRVEVLASVHGHVSQSKGRNFHQLKFAKREGLILLRRMYHTKNAPHLSRKKLKIDKMLSIIAEKI